MKSILYLGFFALIGLVSINHVFAQEPQAPSEKKVIKLYPAKITYPPKQLLLYPNPAVGQVEMNLSNHFDDGDTNKFVVTLSDKQGIELVSQKWNGEKIDVSQFPTGIYIVTLRKDREHYSQKLVVKHE